MGKFTYNSNNTDLARKLRKEQTKHERKLWYDFLNTYPIKFKRQVPIGHAILDFYCPKFKLGIELDGSQHYTDENKIKDAIRTRKLQIYGITIMRIPNNIVDKYFNAVCEYIDNYIKSLQSL